NEQARILIPCARQPVRCQRRRQRSSNHKSKVTASGHTHGRRGTDPVECFQNLGRLGRKRGHRFFQFRQCRQRFRRGRHTTVFQVLEVMCRNLGGAVQELSHLFDGSARSQTADSALPLFNQGFTPSHHFGSAALTN